jgi:hypothetical protein
MVLKRRKVTNSSPTTEVNMKTINNVKGPGIPLVENNKKNTDSEMTKEYFMKNNNVTLNNGLTNNTTNKLNIDKYNDDTTKFVDLEAGNQDSCETRCFSKSWVELYITLLNWKWFTVRNNNHIFIIE